MPVVAKELLDLIDGKAVSAHTHVEVDITDLGSYLTAETNDLSAAVTWANVPDANVTQSSVTQHQSALTITESQISDLGTYLTATSLWTATVFAEIYVKDNAVATTLNSAAKVQITEFDTNGASSGLTPDHTNDHITVVTAGKYLVSASIAIVNVAAQAHTVVVGLFKNNGVTQFDNVHSHRDLAAGGGDKGSMSLSGIVDISASDTIELWANTDSGSNRDVIFEDMTLTMIRVG